MPVKRYGVQLLPEYRIWDAMIQRCTNPKATHFQHYGGRGIVICERWRIFKNFYEDMGAKPDPKMEIDRIDNNRPYSPENCRWATRSEQMSNRRNNHLITHNGRTQTLTQWSKETGLRYNTIIRRIESGWTVEQALTRPQQKGRKPSQRKDAHMITFNGRTQSMRDWEVECGFSVTLLHQRLKLGWSIERALTTPKELRKGK